MEVGHCICLTSALPWETKENVFTCCESIGFRKYITFWPVKHYFLNYSKSTSTTLVSTAVIAERLLPLSKLTWTIRGKLRIIYYFHLYYMSEEWIIFKFLWVIDNCIWVYKTCICQKSTWLVGKHFPKNPLKLNFVNEIDFCRGMNSLLWLGWIWQEGHLTSQ